MSIRIKAQPVLQTKRLVLRPLMAKDDLSVRELANDPQIAGMTLWSMCGSGRKMCRYWIGGSCAAVAHDRPLTTPRACVSLH